MSPSPHIVVLFPHQLFDPVHFPQGVDAVHLVEEPLFFGDERYPLAFHGLKLLFHRLTIDAYLKELQTTRPNLRVVHHPYEKGRDAKKVLGRLIREGVRRITVFDVVDYELRRRIERACPSESLTVLPSPMFFNTQEANAEFFEGRSSYRMQAFYQHQRRTLGILMEADGKPVGGQWSFDEDNRRKVPREMREEIPPNPVGMQTGEIEKAQEWVRNHFPAHLGSVDCVWFAYTRLGAREVLKNFLTERYARFGDFEDAVDTEHWRLWHSSLSLYLNCGLLTPREVLEMVEATYLKGGIPLNAHEGFVRQLIGWREYMRAVYDLSGVSLRTANDWGHERRLSQAWYEGTTGLAPLDRAIEIVQRTGYNHHIERLMVIGNAMFLCEIDPDEVYRWFMELYLDAYDWVMVGNVYGMSQDSQDGLITTKPYFSGSNYLLKMSNYPKKESGEWAEIWDALYWSYLIEHEERLSGNARWAMMMRRVREMDKEKREAYFRVKQEFVEQVTQA